MTEYKLNRMETTRGMGPMVDAYWKAMRDAKANGKMTAWGAGGLAGLLLGRVMDIETHFYGTYISYVGGRGASPELLDSAEKAGYFRDTCSYLRVHLGLVHQHLRGDPVREDTGIPIPDLILTGRVCPEQMHIFESIARLTHIPVIAIDQPVSTWEPVENRVRHVERQLKEMAIPQLERITGRTFNADRLGEILLDLKQTCTVRNECWELMKQVPAPCTIWDYGMSMAPIIMMAGQPGNVEYFQKFKAELEQRVANGIAAVSPREKYRILWDGFLPWAYLGFYSRLFTAHGAVALTGRYPWEMFPNPELIDPSEDPVRNLAKIIIEDLLTNNYPVGGLRATDRLIDEYKIDGMVFYQSRTCRLWNIGQPDTLAAMERKYGIPGVIIEDDMVDTTFHSEAQIGIRLQALFEMIDARRKARS